MKKLSLTKKIVTVAVLASIVGCETLPENVDTENDSGHAVMGLDYRDFNKAASKMISSLLRSGRLKKRGGGMFVMCPGRIVNDTNQRIDTSQLMAKIEEELLNSGLITMTSAVGADGATDEMVMKTRALRGSSEFKQNTIAKKGTILAPDLSISGKILQRDINYDSKKTQIEYYFQLRITDLNSGTRFWQKEEVLAKRGSAKSVSW